MLAIKSLTSYLIPRQSLVFACDGHKSYPQREGRWNLKKENTEKAMGSGEKCCGKKKANTESWYGEKKQKSNFGRMEICMELYGLNQWDTCITLEILPCGKTQCLRLSLRGGVSEQGFKLHRTVNLSRFADKLKINSSSEIFFCSRSPAKHCCFTSCGIDKRCITRFNQRNSCRSYVFSLLVPPWLLYAWLLLCREVWWSCFLEEH